MQCIIVGDQSAAYWMRMPGSTDVDLVTKNGNEISEILDPVYVFLNYAEASDNESIWFDYEDYGALAIERAHALLELYRNMIIPELRMLVHNGDVDEKIVSFLKKRLDIDL